MNPLVRMVLSAFMVVAPTTPFVIKGQHELPEKTEPPSITAVVVVEKTPIATPQPIQKPIKPLVTAQNRPGSVESPEPSSSTFSEENIKEIIVKWANYYGVSSDWMLKVANCESGYHQYAFNGKETPGNSPSGIFQFKPQTFYGNAKNAGLKNPDLWSPEDQAHVAAYMFSIGQSKQWACS